MDAPLPYTVYREGVVPTGRFVCRNRLMRLLWDPVHFLDGAFKRDIERPAKFYLMTDVTPLDAPSINHLLAQRVAPARQVARCEAFKPCCCVEAFLIVSLIWLLSYHVFQTYPEA